ncbi:hypothetical protein [Microbacterium sp. SLBN-146]|uniref:hypothetical protein n=1 Tax=Microbacterium sp. SLBN-146 TaxID=2768457 RepID=UPI00114FA444|nr:hypothetical protein [Microbacterium sp. SLBN-146]
MPDLEVERWYRPCRSARTRTARRTRNAVLRLRDALHTCDVGALRRLLHPRVSLVIDGGGILPAPAHAVTGGVAVTRALVQAIAGVPRASIEEAHVNGQSGLTLRVAGRVIAVMGIGVRGQRIHQIWLIANPVKLTDWNRP